MSPFLGEFFGTAILIFLGTAVVANVILDKTKGNGGGLIVITVGWAMAVMIPAIIFGEVSGSHFNPALTIALGITGGIEWALVPGYIAAQFAGAIVGATLTWLHYRDHFDITESRDSKLGVFATGPAIRKTSSNLISEFLGTFLLVFALLGFGNQPFADGTNFFGVGGLILALGVSLGGTTGYAINPARDLGPRIAYCLFPIKNKRDPDWSYSWVPVVGPLAGAVAAALLHISVF